MVSPPFVVEFGYELDIYGVLIFVWKKAFTVRFVVSVYSPLNSAIHTELPDDIWLRF
jgi:hypothetical protein